MQKKSVSYVYIIRCGDGTLYTGYTVNLEARLAAHKEGKGARYTRGRGPLELVYTEELGDNIAAMRREREIKKLPRAWKESLLAAKEAEVELTTAPDLEGTSG